MKYFEKIAERGIYLKGDHAPWIASGEKKMIVKSRPFNIEDESLLILNKDFAFGKVKLKNKRAISLTEFKQLSNLHKLTEAERLKDWPNYNTLYAYDVESVDRFNHPISWQRPRGIRTFVKDQMRH